VAAKKQREGLFGSNVGNKLKLKRHERKDASKTPVRKTWR